MVIRPKTSHDYVRKPLLIRPVVINILFTVHAQEMVSFNLREEPVIFVGLNHDFVPYSPRDPGSLKGNIANYGVKPEELAETELKIREEVNTFVIFLW